jgi:hypothetical protein
MEFARRFEGSAGRGIRQQSIVVAASRLVCGGRCEHGATLQDGCPSICALGGLIGFRLYSRPTGHDRGDDMSDAPIRGMPPRLLRFDILLSDQLPTLARFEFQADDGNHSFLVKRDMLEAIAQSCLGTAAKLAKANDLA